MCMCCNVIDRHGAFSLAGHKKIWIPYTWIIASISKVYHHYGGLKRTYWDVQRYLRIMSGTTPRSINVLVAGRSIENELQSQPKCRVEIIPSGPLLIRTCISMVAPASEHIMGQGLPRKGWEPTACSWGISGRLCGACLRSRLTCCGQRHLVKNPLSSISTISGVIFRPRRHTGHRLYNVAPSAT